MGMRDWAAKVVSDNGGEGDKDCESSRSSLPHKKQTHESQPKGEGETENFDWSLEGDLATVSCYAATDLENLIVANSSRLTAVTKLTEILRTSMPSLAESVAPRSLVDPVTVVAVNRALSDTSPHLQDSINNLQSLVKEAQNIREQLEQVLASPLDFRRGRLDELKKMQSFCLALSRSALSYEPAFDEPQPRL